ncbi:MAG: phage portal protein [Chlorobium sp.]|jgi:phage portal protein BeeE|nr:phage portal protein [Chlorobium sp.]
MFEQTLQTIGQWAIRKAGINRSSINAFSYQYLVDKPAWLSLSNASEYRKAVAENPVLYGCIDILSTAASNGIKYLADLNGKTIPWSSGKTGVKQAKKLFAERPNPLQSVKEFNYERTYMFFTFGNNYVYLNNPLETYDTDITTVKTMINLPSEFCTVLQTGKIYDQVDIKGIIEKYSLINYTPAKEFSPDNIIHFNDINTSNVGNSIIGTSRLENLRYPITNTQLAFEAMNVILKSRGMQGIIKANNKDATGTQIPLNAAAKKEIDDTFKSDYGLRDSQKQYLISYTDIDFIKTIMNSEELGIYKEFSNNAMIISNGFKVPPELYKTYMQGATFENQVQAERRLYQNTVIPLVENEDQYFTERLKMRDYGFELKTDFSHISCLQEAFKEKATALSMNSRSAELAYNNNVITWNQYLNLIGLDPVSGGDVYKFQRPESKPVAVDAAQDVTV